MVYVPKKISRFIGTIWLFPYMAGREQTGVADTKFGSGHLLVGCLSVLIP